MHGAVWHAMLAATTNCSKGSEYWSVAQVLCDFQGSFAAVSWSCFHGSGHAMLLSGMPPETRHLACFSPTRSTYARSADDLMVPVSLCSAGPSPQHAFLCSDGLFDQFFQLLPLPPESDLWPGLCSRCTQFAGTCFNNYIAGLKLYWPANKIRTGYLEFQMFLPDCAIAMASAARNRGCVFGVSRNQFTFWWRQRSFQGDALVSWCQLLMGTAYVGSAALDERWRTCIGASIFGFAFLYGVSDGANPWVQRLCGELGGANMSGQEAAKTLCLSLGEAVSMPTSRHAVGILPEWFAD